MLYQMLCNKLPFQTETIMDTIAMISEQSDSYEHDPAFKKLTHLEQDLLRRLLKLDPQKRLTASGN
jgi:calcium-dependent protein kinase